MRIKIEDFIIDSGDSFRGFSGFDSLLAAIFNKHEKKNPKKSSH